MDHNKAAKVILRSLVLPQRVEHNETRMTFQQLAPLQPTFATATLASNENYAPEVSVCIFSVVYFSAPSGSFSSPLCCAFCAFFFCCSFINFSSTASGSLTVRYRPPRAPAHIIASLIHWGIAPSFET